MSLPESYVLYPGPHLILDLASQHVPELYDEIAELCGESRKEEKFRALLRRHEKEEPWDDFERAALRRELQDWAKMYHLDAV